MGEFEFERVQELLKIHLSVAVPLAIEELRGMHEEIRIELGHYAAQFITERRTGKAFTQLANGLAAAAFAPGGVKFLGLHFEVLR